MSEGARVLVAWRDPATSMAVALALFHAFGGRFGDNRDWPEIEGWAKSIARTLKSP